MKRLLWFALGLLPSPWLLYLVVHRSEDFDARKKRIEALHESIVECRAAVGRIDDLRARAAEIRADLAKLEGVLPTILDRTVIAEFLTESAGPWFESVQVEEARDQDFYREVAWQVALRAEIAECSAFARRLEAEVRLHEVTGFHFTADPPGRPLCTVSGKVFGRQPPS